MIMSMNKTMSSILWLSLINSMILIMISQRIHAKFYQQFNEHFQSLCENPVFYTADRLVNNSVRIYRDKYFWELNGLPAKVGSLRGPFRMWYSNFVPIYQNTSVATILEGYRKGFAIKFQDQKWYAWNNGHQGWGDHGTHSPHIPPGGFDTVFHNGNSYEPMLIGIKANKAHYISTRTDIWPHMKIVGDSSGYIGGQFRERFESDLTASFSYPSDSSNYYSLYMFRGSKYCVRTSREKCNKWRENRELFGCYRKDDAGRDSGWSGSVQVVRVNNGFIFVALSLLFICHL